MPNEILSQKNNSGFMNPAKLKLVLNIFFFLFQCIYYSIIGCFTVQNCTTRLSRSHERYLLVIYFEDSSSDKEFQEKDNFVSIYQRYIQVLAAKMLRNITAITQKIIIDFFPISQVLIFKPYRIFN